MKKTVITFHYTLKNSKGTQIESSKNAEPMRALAGMGQIIPALEAEMSTMKKGDKKTVALDAKDAYGEFDESLIVNVPRSELPDNSKIKEGTQFQSELPDGRHQVFTVTKMTTSDVTMDGNHPLAGQDLVFDVEIVEIRDATEEELQHGHAHGGDGHHHH